MYRLKILRTGKEHKLLCFKVLLPTGSEERGVLGVRDIPVAILPFTKYEKYGIIVA